eukprot:gene6769-7567_t
MSDTEREQTHLIDELLRHKDKKPISNSSKERECNRKENQMATRNMLSSQSCKRHKESCINDEQEEEQEVEEAETSTVSLIEDKHMHLSSKTNCKVTNEIEDDLELCPICLDTLQDKAFLDSCFHAFCFACIMTWLEVVRTCPLCKTSSTVVIHSIKSDTIFERLELPKEPIQPSASAVRIIDPMRRHLPSSGDHRLGRSRYFSGRGRYTSSNGVSHAARRARSFGVVHSSSATATSQATEQRRTVYATRMRALPERNPDLQRRQRSLAPSQLLRDLGNRQRILQWVHREVHALLSRNADFVCAFVESLLSTSDLRNTERMVRELSPFLRIHTDLFVYELQMFARSPLNISAYDKHVMYQAPTSDHERELAQQYGLTLFVPSQALTHSSPSQAKTFEDCERMGVENHGPLSNNSGTSIEANQRSSVQRSNSIRSQEAARTYEREQVSSSCCVEGNEKKRNGSTGNPVERFKRMRNASQREKRTFKKSSDLEEQHGKQTRISSTKNEDTCSEPTMFIDKQLGSEQVRHVAHNYDYTNGMTTSCAGFHDHHSEGNPLPTSLDSEESDEKNLKPSPSSLICDQSAVQNTDTYTQSDLWQSFVSHRETSKRLLGVDISRLSNSELFDHIYELEQDLLNRRQRILQ